MTVRTKRLFGPVTVTNVNQLLYTCPAGRTAILKEIWVSDQGSTAATVRFFVNGVGTPARIYQFPLLGSDAIHFGGLFIVLHPGDVFRAILSAAANYTLMGNGSELDGVAP